MRRKAPYAVTLNPYIKESRVKIYNLLHVLKEKNGGRIVACAAVLYEYLLMLVGLFCVLRYDQDIVFISTAMNNRA